MSSERTRTMCHDYIPHSRSDATICIVLLSDGLQYVNTLLHPWSQSYTYICLLVILEQTFFWKLNKNYLYTRTFQTETAKNMN